MTMKILLSILFGAIVLSSAARSEHIALSATPDAGICGLQMIPYTPTTVHVVHVLSPGSLGSAFSIENTAVGVISLGGSCLGGIPEGDPSGGVAVGYGGCATGTFPICQFLFYKVVGEAIPGCYHLNIRPHPLHGILAAAGCDETMRPVPGGYFTFDLDVNFMCDDCVTATEPTTWGAVKALYR